MTKEIALKAENLEEETGITGSMQKEDMREYLKLVMKS